MVCFANKYADRIEFIFKPHPLLKVKLYHHTEWGIEKTNKYYKVWADLPNGSIEVDDYKKVFNDSNAMIFDCNSFIAEYLYTGKPSLFMLRDDSIKKIFNKFGEMALNNHYQGYSESDISAFIEKVVLGGYDDKKEIRDKFYRENLISPNSKTASENIVEEIIKSIFTV